MDNVGRNLETNFLTVNLKFSLRFSSDRIGTESTEKGSQNGPPVVRRSKGQAAKRWSVGDTFFPRFSQRPQGRHFAWGRGNGNVCQLTVCFSPQKDSLLVHLCIAAPSQGNPLIRMLCITNQPARFFSQPGCGLPPGPLK